MARYDNAPFEIHVHGQVPLRPDVTFDQLQEALRPLWKYAGARSLADGAQSAYEEEPGLRFDAQEHLLQMCWTVAGDEDFRQALDEMCMSLNELSQQGAVIEVTFYDTEFDEEEEAPGAESRDDFVMLFVGPTPAAIMQVQRDLLVQDVIHLMERHFDAAELGGVVSEIDRLFNQRFDALVSSLEIGKPPRGLGGGGHGGSGHGGGRKPRHLH
jgi:lipopolysaccharide biosynthesis regulator YciM